MESVDVLPTSCILTDKIWFNMYTLHLELSRIIHNSIWRRTKTKSRLECRHRILGRATKKGISCIILIPLVVSGVPNEIWTRVAGVKGQF